MGYVENASLITGVENDMLDVQVSKVGWVLIQYQWFHIGIKFQMLLF